MFSVNISSKFTSTSTYAIFSSQTKPLGIKLGYCFSPYAFYMNIISEVFRSDVYTPGSETYEYNLIYNFY